MSQGSNYYLSVEQTDSEVARRRWAAESVLGRKARPVRERAVQGLRGGCVALVHGGRVVVETQIWSPMGLCGTENGLLVGTPWSVLSFEPDLRGPGRTFATGPWSNFIHTIRPGPRGLLVASTGVDALIELDASGEPSWSWWATEHGFDRDPEGRARSLDPTEDHRGWKYDTWNQVAHLNSAVRLPGSEVVLATLFHQGSIVRIDPDGGWTTVLEGLTRPHGLRVLGPDRVSVANSRRGRVLVLQASWARAEVEGVRVIAEIDARTRWLQDAVFCAGVWMLVDGHDSEVRLADHLGRPVGVHVFPRAWRLFEVSPA